MRIVHRTAAVLLGVAAAAAVVWLAQAAISGDDIKVVNFVLYVIGVLCAIALAQFLWRDPS